MSLESISTYVKKNSHPIIHLDVEINLGILSAILWVNIPGIAGIISACCIFALMVLYLFVAFNESSWVNVWIDGLMHKINMKSLLRPRSVNDRRLGALLFSIGFLDFIEFYILYYIFDLPALASFCMIIGKLLKFTGAIKLYQGAETIKSDRIWRWVLVISCGAYSNQIAYFIVLMAMSL